VTINVQTHKVAVSAFDPHMMKKTKRIADEIDSK